MQNHTANPGTQVVVVTGAAMGIGRAIAHRFVAAGARVAYWDIDSAAAAAACAAASAAGGAATADALAVGVDVADEHAVARACTATLTAFGRVDVLVNNAGISRHRSLEETSLSDFEAVLKVCVTGTFLCCRALSPVMRQQRSGSIVNVASLGARTGRPGVGVNYAAAKSAIVGITQVLARELGAAGIRVNAVAPGPILTAQTAQYPAAEFARWNAGRAIDRDGTPEDVADAVLFLASERAGWITGVTLDINGGILIRG